MRRFGLTIVFLFACALLLTGCGEQEEPVKSEPIVTSEEIRKETKEPLEKTIAFAQQQREEDQNKEDQADLNRKIEEARKKQEVVNQKLEELKSTTAKAWKDIKPALDAAIDALEKAYGEVLSRLK